MRTASSLNSSLCITAISDLLDGEDRSQKTGTEPVQVHPAWKTKSPRAEATTPEPVPISEAPGTGAPLPPPHPALVELVRLMARADARRARAEEKETR